MSELAAMYIGLFAMLGLALMFPVFLALVYKAWEQKSQKPNTVPLAPVIRVGGPVGATGVTTHQIQANMAY